MFSKCFANAFGDGLILFQVAVRRVVLNAEFSKSETFRNIRPPANAVSSAASSFDVDNVLMDDELPTHLHQLAMDFKYLTGPTRRSDIISGKDRHFFIVVVTPSENR